MHWVSKITSALAEDRLVMYVQPVISVKQPQQANHFEVLVRMQEGDKLVAPGQFLPAAERYGLMDEIDRTVLLKVIEFIAQTPASSTSFAVNLSGTTLSDDSFAEFVLSEVNASGIDARRLHFEVTETAAVGNLSAALKLMKCLKALGCKFYLDDFGSGLSSFAYLKGLPVDYLKIDGSFVRAMTPGSIDFAMVSSINHLAKVMGLKTVAEFVENSEVLHLLEEIGVDYAQGYYFAEPSPMLALQNK
jgi:EAL domain-containing protein (putative c-di-GMP-specific phosphodiesterase class I)